MEILVVTISNLLEKGNLNPFSSEVNTLINPLVEGCIQRSLESIRTNAQQTKIAPKQDNRNNQMPQ